MSVRDGGLEAEVRETASYEDLFDELREIDRCMGRFMRDSILKLEPLEGDEGIELSRANLCVKRAMCDVLIASSHIAQAVGHAGDGAR